MEKERFVYLIRQHSLHLLSSAEKAELKDWLADAANREAFVDLVTPRMMEDPDRMEYQDVLWQPVLDVVLRQDRSLSGEGEQELSSVVTDRRPAILRRARWFVAAAILFAVAGIYLLLNRRSQPAANVPKTSLVQDVPAPAQARAVITLADGRQVVLDSSGAGTLALQGGMHIIKQANGQIAYSGEAVRTAKTAYNTLTVPRGSRVVQLGLADGTKVWLNSGSSLRYPAAFTGNQRVVDVTGEAYFEIARDPASPFIVRKDSLDVQVLGTHFNINAYSDEKGVRVTLLEGGVKVMAAGAGRVLQPGQQALVNHNIQVLTGIDTSGVMAWKNGLFQFGDATDITAVMRQLSRWYDVEVEYEGGATRHIGGTISRNVNISRVLAMLEMTDAVHFRVEGKKVIVLP